MSSTHYFSSDDRITICSTSKGAQPKYKKDGFYIKQDMQGYEGLSEIIAYRLMKNTNLSNYRHAEYYPLISNGIYGCKSPDFANGLAEVTLYRALTQYFSTDLEGIVKYYTEKYDYYRFTYYEFILDSIDSILKYDAATFLSLLLEFDRLIMNDDRHFNNILFLQNSDSWEPIAFDYGAAFCSDLTRFPISTNPIEELDSILAKPFKENFDDQVRLVQNHSRERLRFNGNTVNLEITDLNYPENYIQRVKMILEHQMSKYFPDILLRWI